MYVGPEARTISVQGRVQGVGFRPYIFRLATGFGITGWVQNTNAGVVIFCEGDGALLDSFQQALHSEAPAASCIESISVSRSSPAHTMGFRIMESADTSDEITEISPDIAVCDDCLADMKLQPHRIDYPLINCTHCGPRFTIVKALPYDRPNTTMEVFPLCETCATEYSTVSDRRFHAQPVACNHCGPGYELWADGHLVTSSLPAILNLSAETINSGGILALKGVGGYHLLCDAGSTEAVKLLRERKGRESKPLAVMFASIERISAVTHMTFAEEEALRSWQRPVVLLTLRSEPPSDLSPLLNEGLDTLGVILPYMPMHYLLLEKLSSRAVVLTSGNFTGSPILTDNADAISRFRAITPVVVAHQREIHNRIDDSVVRQIGDQVRVLRRARGYTPDPVRLSCPAEGILATGAELVNCFCIGKGARAYLSQYIGDLKQPDVQEFYQQAVIRFSRLLRTDPNHIVTDLHPDYFSTKAGKQMAEEGKQTGGSIRVVQVQHHHAHIASCMAEHHLDEPVIGVAFDGTGLGPDGHSWGSEIMIADLLSFKRFTHFDYLPMPGGDKAVSEPWRMGISALYSAYGEEISSLNLPFVNAIPPDKLEWILQMLRKGVNTPLTCGAGRYFDAVAAMLGICFTSGYEGEGPMKQEALTRPGIDDDYPVDVNDTVSMTPTFRRITEDLLKGVPSSVIATRFHNTVARVVVQEVVRAHRESGLDKIVLSGGVFQNRYLAERIILLLRSQQLNLYLHASVPPNDGGIALGQLAIAAKRRDCNQKNA